jgi:hypothetical protein
MAQADPPSKNSIETQSRRVWDVTHLLHRPLPGPTRDRGSARPTGGHPTERAALIREIATSNRWGAERIRGELLKLGIRVSKRTVQRCMRSSTPQGGNGQRWSTFLRRRGAVGRHGDDSTKAVFWPIHRKSGILQSCTHTRTTRRRSRAPRSMTSTAPRTKRNGSAA